jgi:hypothetical protein
VRKVALEHVRQVYLPIGIDVAKTHASITDDAVVHDHAADDKCGNWKHTLYRDGNKVDEWGIHGQSHTPNVQGQ